MSEHLQEQFDLDWREVYYLKRKRENLIQELESLSFPWHHTRWTWNVLNGKMEKERIVESRIGKSSLLSFCGREGTNWQKRWVAREKVSMELQIIIRSVDKITLPKYFKPPVQIMQQLTSTCKLHDSQMNTFWEETPKLLDSQAEASEVWESRILKVSKPDVKNCMWNHFDSSQKFKICIETWEWE